MKWAAAIAGILLIALSGCSLFGQRQDLPTQRDYFIYGIALEFKDPALCQKIPLDASNGGSSWSTPAGYQISYLQSDCYYNLAGSTHDLSLCDHVRPLSTSQYDGSKYNPEDCRKHSEAAPVIGGADPHTVVQWLKKLGYTDADIYADQYKSNLQNPIYKYYDQVRRDNQFAAKIAASPSFDEPLAEASFRPANDLEYLYQMFGVDSEQATVCDKVSPNAQAEWADGKRYSLRLECYRDIAFNTRDLAACDRVPLRNALPPGETQYGSREACRQNIPALLHPDTKNLTYGPARPPTFSSFQNGLRQLGYNPTFPELTWREYEDFLMHLAYTQGNESARVEFLRRVQALE